MSKSPPSAAHDSFMASEQLSKSNRSVSSGNVHSGESVGGSNGEGQSLVKNSQLEGYNKVGGTLGLPAVEGNGGIAIPGQGPGLDGFFTKINENSALTNSLADSLAGVAAHQAGGELELSKTDLNKPSAGVGAMAKLDNVKPGQLGMFANNGEGASH
jgi:hypothetical protein